MFKSSILILLLFHICLCEKKQDVVQKSLSGSKKAVDLTNKGIQGSIKAAVALPFKPLDYTVRLFESGVTYFFKFVDKIGGMFGGTFEKYISKIQKREEKIMTCVQDKQFDPITKIIVDISKCATDKLKDVTAIFTDSIKGLNTTYGIIKRLAKLPQCGNANCWSDYVLDITKDLGSIGKNLFMIVEKVAVGFASIPITLPTCIATKPATAPLKVLPLLGLNLLKCITG